MSMSKKAAAAIATAVLVVANEWLGLGIDEETVTKLVGLAVAYLLGQGIADAGKEQAKESARAAVIMESSAPTVSKVQAIMKGKNLALFLVPLLLLSSCASPTCLPVEDVEDSFVVLADRHDAYVIGDPDLDQETKEVYLRTSELLRSAIAEAKADQ